MVVFPLALVLLTRALVALAAVDTQSACAYACQTPFASIQFGGDDPTADYYTTQCLSELRVSSVFVCIRDRCTETEIQHGLDTLNHDCETYGMVSLLPFSIVSNITKEDEAAFRVVGETDMVTMNPAAEIFNETVRLDDSLFQVSDRTIVTWQHSEITRANYSYAMYGFWAIVLLIGFVNRVVTFFARSGSSTPDANGKQLSTMTRLTRQYLTTPTLAGHHKAEPLGWCTVPARLQSLTLISFLIINVILSFVSIDVFTGNLYWAENKTQWWRYFADRTGCISMANMPLMWAFAMRNNVLIWLTGWSFTTFNQFHRWVARIATIEAVAHSVGYTVMVFYEGGKTEYVTEWAERYWWMGAIATIVMSILCGVSIQPIRKFVYEAFLLIHIALAALFLAAMYYHVEIFEGEYNGYIWPCVAVWVFDRVLRVGRLVFVNLSSCKAVVTYNSEANVIRINVPVRSKATAGPGSYYYIYALHGLRLWESHPFTLSSWTDTTETDNKSGQTLSFVVRPYKGFTARLRDHIVRSRDGENNTTSISSKTMRVVVEGPYGVPHTISHFTSGLFIIGGSGITVALSHIRALSDTLNSSSTALQRIHLVWAVRDRALFQEIFDQELSTLLVGNDDSNDSQIKTLSSKLQVQIDLYVTGNEQPTGKNEMTKRTSAEIQSTRVLAELAELEKETNVTVTATATPTASAPVVPGEKHVKEISPSTPTSTTRSSMSRDSASDAENSTTYGSTGNVRITVHAQRPDVHRIIGVSAARYATGGQSMAVVSCGPARMADDARAGVVAALSSSSSSASHDKPTSANVQLFDEQFGW